MVCVILITQILNMFIHTRIVKYIKLKQNLILGLINNIVNYKDFHIPYY
jgi:hypothetical protein